MLTKDQILAADDLTRESLDVPEWGGAIYVKVMTAGERDRFEKKWAEDRYGDLRAYMATTVVCDAAGAPLFTPADVPALTRKSASALDRIFAVALRLNKMTPDDVKGLEKN